MEYIIILLLLGVMIIGAISVFSKELARKRNFALVTFIICNLLIPLQFLSGHNGQSIMWTICAVLWWITYKDYKKKTDDNTIVTLMVDKKPVKILYYQTLNTGTMKILFEEENGNKDIVSIEKASREVRKTIKCSGGIQLDKMKRIEDYL